MNRASKCVLLLVPFLAAGFFGCAPQVDPSVPPPPPTPSPEKREEPVAPAQDLPPEEPAGIAEAALPPRLNAENPDWERRYEELVAFHRTQFVPPKPGTPVRIWLASGRQKQGVLSEVTESELMLLVEEGTITYTPASLGPGSAKRFFADNYARQEAIQQVQKERYEWHQLRTSTLPEPPPEPLPPPYGTAVCAGGGSDVSDSPTAVTDLSFLFL